MRPAPASLAVVLLLVPAAGQARAADHLPLAPFSPAQPAQLSGGKSPPYKPRNWEETRYLEVTPAMTLAQGRLMVMEGFVYPEPGAPLCVLGGFDVAGMAEEGKLRPGSTALRAVLDYGGGTEVHLNRISPGLLLKTDAEQVQLFTSRRLSVDPWRASGTGLSRPPARLAFSAGGKVRAVQAAGEVPLAGMDQPWILAWWDGSHKFDVPVRPAGGGPRRNIWPIYPASSSLRVRRGAGEWPMLIVLQKRPRRLTADKDGWTFHFAAPAGHVIVAPLFGRRWVSLEEIAKWKDGPPEEAVGQARRWTARLRAIPVDVTTTQRLVAGRPTFTESFQFERIADDWQTPPRPWAPIPPMFALARAMGLPVEADGEKPIQDWQWLGRLGPLAGLDDAAQITYRINLKQLDRYLAPPARRPPAGSDDPKYKLLRDQLGKEIAKVIQAGHMAPHMWPFGEMSASYYAPTYFHNPGQTFITLIRALDHLGRPQADRLRAYLRREFKTHSPFALEYWGKAADRKGARRERFPEDAQPRHWVAGANFNLQSLYAAWLYYDRVADPAERPAVWQAASQCLQRHRARAAVEWDYTDMLRFPVQGTPLGTHMTHQNHPSVESRFESFNSRVNGLIGYTRLARLAGEERAAETGTCLLARALALRFAQLYFDQYLIQLGVHQPQPLPPPLADNTRRLQSLTLMRGLYIGPRLAWTYIWKENTPESAKGVGARVYFFHVNHPVWSASQGSGGVSGGRDVIDAPLFFIGLDLTPGTAGFYRDYCRDFVELAFKHLALTAPTWYVADGPTYWSSEESVGPPEVPWACFLAKAMILQADGRELYKYVDFPQAAFGDLYYLGKLCAALEAFARKAK